MQVGVVDLSKWIDEGDYFTMKYVTHDKNPMRVIISVRKDTKIDNKSNQSNQGKQGIKSGE